VNINMEDAAHINEHANFIFHLIEVCMYVQ
jgi:hypothetical protein